MSSELSDIKSSFLANEIALLSLNGAFQRNKIYEASCKTDKDREPVRLSMKKLSKEFFDKFYKTEPISSREHIHKLLDFKAQIEAQHSSVLRDKSITIGTIQKMFNLYLKYQWCMGNCETPPHCPFDAIIIGKLGLSKPVTWTNINDVGTYQELVDAANAKKAETNSSSIAEWELKAFIRPGDTFT